jgi:hypothetical protein
LEKYIEGRYRGERREKKKEEKEDIDSGERHRSIDRGKDRDRRDKRP